ncbi:hypothetical protein ACFL2U_00995 [Patescibacteria group bacterium]
MAAQKDDGNVLDFFKLEEELDRLEGLYGRYSTESLAIEKKLANGMTQCRETREGRLRDLKKRLMPELQGKIESIRSILGGGPPLP